VVHATRVACCTYSVHEDNSSIDGEDVDHKNVRLEVVGAANEAVLEGQDGRPIT
jgi:hypothetical protein